MNVDGAVQLGRREQNKAETRLAIQRAAVELFEERGYDQTTVDDIARRAEVAPRTFFRYFPSKELTLFSDDVSERLATLIARAPAHLSPLDTLELCLAQLMEDDPSDLDRRRQSLRRQLSEQPGVTRQFAHVQNLIAERTRVAFLDRLQHTGEPHPELMADAIVAIQLGLALTFTDGEPDQREIVRHWFDAVRAVIGQR
ncbi:MULTISPECIES: TetR/AcrR family transcriptional regulator [Actinomycetes]|uniref:TetR/AcrR family transcriptional regulator n=1 Tax=Actinomycetes TaxID=1760 RepID=UPI002AC6D523|nr:TetR family transcriptional regulator [Nesterenkonia sp. HG001]MDZ5079201.1 TetR family transcriptional regulator [Nesterenkonia sp. HG001]